MFKSTIYSIVIAGGLIAGVFEAVAANPADPCSLLTTEQVGGVLGFPVGPGKSLAAQGCSWHGTGKEATGSKRVVLQLQTIDAFAVGRSPIPGADKPAAGGIGDDAYYMYMTDPRYTKLLETGLNVKKGSQAFALQVWGYPTEEGKKIAKQLALQVIAKL